MRILFVSPRQAWPLTSGAKLREYYFARALSSLGSLTCLHFPETGTLDPEACRFFSRITSVPRPRAYTPAKVLKGFAGRWPLSVVNYTSSEMARAIAAELSSGSYDLVHLDAVQLAAYAPEIVRRGVPVIFNWHNIESELMDRYAANTPSPAHRLYARFTAHRLRSLERWLLRIGSGHVVCSSRERDQLLAVHPGAPVDVVDNGVDTAFFPTSETPHQSRNTLVFVGTMSYHANIEAAVWFTRDVWPHIRAKYPGLRLALVGANPAPEVRSLSSIEGVEVTGTVDDVRPWYGQALAALAPIRTAGGTRLKILEAMAAGVPVIATALGAEGLEVSPGQNAFLAEGPVEWVDAVGRLQDPVLWHQLAGNGMVLVRERYDWTMLGRRLCRLYETWASAASAATAGKLR